MFASIIVVEKGAKGPGTVEFMEPPVSTGDVLPIVEELIGLGFRRLFFSSFDGSDVEVEREGELASRGQSDRSGSKVCGATTTAGHVRRL